MGKSVPNKPFIGEYSQEFNIIKSHNYLLALELSKLPELQDGISPEEARAIKILSQFYLDNVKTFDGAFDEMYQEGLPEIRSYCTPLQAIFWLSLEERSDEISNIISNYSLPNLLDAAWKFKNDAVFTNEEMLFIIDGINDSEMRERFSEWDHAYAERRIFYLMRRKPEILSPQTKKLIMQKKDNLIPVAWRNFSEVVDRLNSPNLLDYYEKRNIQWVDWRSLPTWPVSPYFVFRYKKGDCTSISNFTALCLMRAGYKAFEFKVPPTRPVDAHHSVCIFEDNGTKFVMDNGKMVPAGIQPYEYLKMYY